MAIGERVAHPMSHAPMANCSQCHVERDGAPFGHVLELPESEFEGFRPERRGLSSIAGAPPLMPHGTDMRTRCLSCHGEFGYPGLRTSHPRRANCTQCHTTPGAR
jgi:cytochrome c-type protein NapB